jgi:hypothetical protein
VISFGLSEEQRELQALAQRVRRARAAADRGGVDEREDAPPELLT